MHTTSSQNVMVNQDTVIRSINLFMKFERLCGLGISVFRKQLVFITQ